MYPRAWYLIMIFFILAHVTLAPWGTYVTPAPRDTYVALAPRGTYVTPAPRGTYVALAPRGTYVTPAILV